MTAWTLRPTGGATAPFLSGALLFAACSGTATPATVSVTMADSSGVAIISNVLRDSMPACRLAPDPTLRIGGNESDETQQLHRVFGATVLGDGRVALVNQGSQELRFYSPRGEFLSASGREGQGPGEFQDAFLLWRLPGDTLWAGDYRPWQFEVFAPCGEWVRQIRPSPQYENPPDGGAILDDGRFIIANRNVRGRSPSFELRHLYLELHDAAGTLLDTVAVLPNGRHGQIEGTNRMLWLYPWFESFAHFAARGHRLVTGEGGRAELRIHDMSSGVRLDRIVRWSGLDRTVQASDVEAAKEAERVRYRDMKPELYASLVAPLLHDDRPVAETFPTVTDIVVGTDGALWVGGYPRPGERREVDWLRFDDQGRFVCRAPIRRGLQEFGPDYVLGKESDELGIESVVIYPLSPAGSDS